LVFDRVILGQVDRDHVLFRVAGRFVDSERGVACFAEAHTHFAFFITDDDRYRERESASTGNDARHAADRDHLRVKLAARARWACTLARAALATATTAALVATLLHWCSRSSRRDGSLWCDYCCICVLSIHIVN